MPNSEVLNVVGHASDVSLHIAGYPRIAIIRFTIGGKKHTLSLTCPTSRTATDTNALEVLTYVFHEFYGFIVTDRNVAEPNCLEFGRYQIELQTYDGDMGQVDADSYSYSADDG